MLKKKREKGYGPIGLILNMKFWYKLREKYRKNCEENRRTTIIILFFCHTVTF